MGILLSRWRKKPSTRDTLDKIQKDIIAIENFKRETISWQKKVVGILLLSFSLLYLLAAAIAYFRFLNHPEWQSLGSQASLWLPFFIAPVLLMFLKQFLTWWYHRKVRGNESQLSALIKQRSEILNEVMEKETYKVAKEILEKYAPDKLVPKQYVSPRAGPVARPTPTNAPRVQTTKLPPATSTSEANSVIRRRFNAGPTDPNVSVQQGITPTRTQGSTSNQSLLQSPRGPEASMNMSRNPVPPGSPRAPSVPPAPPGPPLPRPILQRERGYMDKLVEYLVGDGPSNRFALICKMCQSHNGMALKEEFEFIAYRCAYCHYWNPARKQRPQAPRLPLPPKMNVPSSSSESSDDESKNGTESQKAVATTKEVQEKHSDNVSENPRKDAPKVSLAENGIEKETKSQEAKEALDSTVANGQSDQEEAEAKKDQ